MSMKRIICLFCAAALALANAAASAGEVFIVTKIAAKQQTIPDTQALAFTRSMKIGWNLGNTFDAADCGWLSNGLLYESAWVGVMTQPGVFDALAEAGFATVRIPVSWHNHVSGEDMRIDEAWLARVKEVIGYALDRGLYVIVNSHHDIGEDYVYPDSAHYENSAKFIRCVWTQVAQAFAEYDDHLIFEGMNEPRLKGTDVEWYLKAGDARCLDAIDCINRLNQLFVDTVRSSGGHNVDRYLLAPGYGASLDGAVNNHFVLPVDSAENRIIVSVHAYTPYNFALRSPTENMSTNVFDPDKQQDRKDINWLMESLYKKFIQNGIPVVIGEYGARDKDGNVQARADYTACYVAVAAAHGIPCIVWDNHAFAGSGELFGLLDRKNFAFVYPEIIQSMMAYALTP